MSICWKTRGASEGSKFGGGGRFQLSFLVGEWTGGSECVAVETAVSVATVSMAASSSMSRRKASWSCSPREEERSVRGRLGRGLIPFESGRGLIPFESGRGLEVAMDTVLATVCISEGKIQQKQCRSVITHVKNMYIPINSETTPEHVY